jgi:hypothetical protein
VAAGEGDGTGVAVACGVDPGGEVAVVAGVDVAGAAAGEQAVSRIKMKMANRFIGFPSIGSVG